MASDFFADENFKGLDSLDQGKYEECTFIDCDFSDTDLAEFKFVDCIFQNCNLTNAKILDTQFMDVEFSGCKLVGLQFRDCHSLGFNLVCEDCQLNNCSFFQLHMNGSKFKGCKMTEVDFAEADLANSTLNNCDLLGSIFDYTNLEKADLRNSYNFQIDPDQNKIKGARFSQDGLPGLLIKYGLKIEN